MSHTKASLIAQANDFIHRFGTALERYDALKWEIGSLMHEAKTMPDEMYSQVLPASEKMMHVLRQYQLCAELWEEGERNYSLPWVHHHILRHHPKRAEWLEMCETNGILCDRVLRDLLNR